MTHITLMSDDTAPGGGAKVEGAMLAIGELANRIGVPTHVLRYWETRFPELRPLQRSGRRRYYRAEDIALAERIHHLLHNRGFTVEGARKALSEGEEAVGVEARAPVTRDMLDGADGPGAAKPDGAGQPTPARRWQDPSVPVLALIEVRQRLATALAADGDICA